ncbi:MAG: YbaB/EbfC family nucleoid-associated protein [Planctomycetota bacterium]
MFDQLKAMQSVAALLKNKEQLAETGERIKARTGALRVIGEAGGGACRVTMTGRMQVTDLVLDPALLAGMAVDDKTRELATSLIREAVNDATERAQEQVRALIAREAEEIGLPGLTDQLSGLLG